MERKAARGEWTGGSVPYGYTFDAERHLRRGNLLPGDELPAPHEPLVEKALFERAQEILQERSEDVSRRRTNQSKYLLTGLVKCAHCGKRYLGASAKGNGGRYAPRGLKEADTLC
jgi:hypothetical protein